MFFVAGMLYVIFCMEEDAQELLWEEYTVKPGDTLWAIAQRVKHQPVDKTIWQIRHINGGLDPLIRPGQTILVPKIEEDDSHGI